MLKITEASHLDHGLTPAHVAWILASFADKDAFFIATVELPSELAPVTCGLYGPLLGDEPVSDSEVKYATRGSRTSPSRLVVRPARVTHKLTIIAGPHEGDACVLYAAFGGSPAPREPGDPGLTTPELKAESEAFWSVHALAITSKTAGAIVSDCAAQDMTDEDFEIVPLSVTRVIENWRSEAGNAGDLLTVRAIDELGIERAAKIYMACVESRLLAKRLG